MTTNRLIHRRVIFRAASLITASGSIVTRGVVMTSLAFLVSGFWFLATTRLTMSRSVIMPMGVPILFWTITAPRLFWSMISAALLEVSFSSIVTTGLLMMSRTNILGLKPISDIDVPAFS